MAIKNIIRTPFLEVKINGSAVDGVLEARTQLGYNLAIAQGEVTLTELPAGCDPFSPVQITMGAATPGVVRFTGMVTQIEHELYPKTIKVTCRSNLQRAEIFQTQTDIDMTSYATVVNLQGGVGEYGHTDEDTVSTCLYLCGIYAGPEDWQPYVTPGIGGTGIILGKTVADGNSGFTWVTGESALSFIQKLDAICLGYRIFDLADGTTVRQAISALPSLTASKTFTEHVDIYRAMALDTVLEAKNRVTVRGFKKELNQRFNAPLPAITFAANQWLEVLSGAAPDWYVTHTFSSAMIEDGGISPDMVAAWLLAELNVRRLRVNLTTHRDDDIAPGATIAIVSPTRLGITTQNFWVQEVSCEVNRQNQFSQSLICIGVVGNSLPVLPVTRSQSFTADAYIGA